MDIIVLASGSKGNATYIRSKETTLLIDAGVSFKQIRTRLESQGETLSELDAVLLTHEHSDHTRGLHQTIKQTDAAVYTAPKTYTRIKKLLKDPHDHIPVEADRPFMFKDLIVTPIKTSHDAAHSLGFIIQEDDQRLVYITDTGFLEEKDFPKIKNADMYILESNYDVALLFDSERPFYLKKRIDSVKGHLSNADSAYYLTRLIGERTKKIILAHGSEECNNEACVLKTIDEVFESYAVKRDGIEFFVAKQHVPSKMFQL